MPVQDPKGSVSATSERAENATQTSSTSSTATVVSAKVSSGSAAPRVAQEPPRLGRRTNYANRRVVRATGAKDSEVTKEEVSAADVKAVSTVESSVSSPVSIPAAPTGEEPGERKTRRVSTKRAAVNVASDVEGEQKRGQKQNRGRRVTSDALNSQVRDDVHTEDRAKDRTDEITADTEISTSRTTHTFASTSASASTRARYERSERQQRIADEIFVDKGIEIADAAQDRPSPSDNVPEVDGGQTAGIRSGRAQRRTRVSHEQDALQDAATTESINQIIETTRASKVRKSPSSARSSRAQQVHDDSATQGQLFSQASDDASTSRYVGRGLEFSAFDVNRETPRQTVAPAVTTGAPTMGLLFQAPILPDRSSTGRKSSEDRNSSDRSTDRANERSSRRSTRDDSSEQSSARTRANRRRVAADLDDLGQDLPSRKANMARKRDIGRDADELFENISQALDNLDDSVRHDDDDTTTRGRGRGHDTTDKRTRDKREGREERDVRFERDSHRLRDRDDEVNDDNVYDGSDDESFDEDNSSRIRSRRGRNHEDNLRDGDSRESRRNRRGRNNRRGNNDGDLSERNSYASDDDYAADDSGDSDFDYTTSRRSRRLNAQERRAAAEVEQIEADLVYDDIDYDPIESEIDDAQSDDKNEQTERTDRAERGERSTRRRHRRDDSERSDEEPHTSRRAAVDSDDDNDDEEEFTTRRRRRRRGNKASDEDASANVGSAVSADDAPLRSRKQQYIDEITDIEGSTRLEAKRQRRRDNRRDRNRQVSLITEQDFLARREVVNRIMVVRAKGKHTQISVIEDDVLVEHYISDIAEVSAVGNIYQGRVQNVLPSMEAAFVDIGQARNGVLYAGEVNWDTTRLDGQPRRMEHAFKSGDPVLVQVTKDPIGHKGARLTSQVTLAGRFLVLVPAGGMTGVSRKLPERERARLKSIVAKAAPPEMGVIIRTAAEGASEEAIIKDLEHLTRQWDHISRQLEEFKHSKKTHLLQSEPDVVIRVIRDIFNDDFRTLIVEGEEVYERIREYIDASAPDLLDRVEQWNPEEHRGKDVFDRWQIDSQLRKGMERQVYLPSGGSLVIDRTEAMTTIDVNTGRFIGKGKSLEETVTRCNLEAAEEVVRQLRLRDIGGMVMIDFVDMVMPANRDLVLRRLLECLSRDRTKHQVAEVTSLGLVQMTRKRVGQGLVEAFSEECPTCAGRGFILHDEPTVSAQYDDPYAMKGGDPFVKTNKYQNSGHSSRHANDKNASADRSGAERTDISEVEGGSAYNVAPSVATTDEVRNSMAAIAAASKSERKVPEPAQVESAEHKDVVRIEGAQSVAAEAAEVSAASKAFADAEVRFYETDSSETDAGLADGGDLGSVDD